ncbi:hypothetical protein BD289DRAFT_509830 [Coniella lustricola]|uniref:NAD-dependent epimerase/dehydratase domain-containing protein n=1 Tax=Coniella lustricola TaxID=2025994 RepID=A0A2T2ZTA0_9PEZI|nr:hypothetical protein BD289DRAFT_509830 [Coniella lustricola]
MTVNGTASHKAARILITGAAGFIGQALAAALLQDPAVSHLVLTDVVVPPTPKTNTTTTATASSSSSCEIRTLAADLTSPSVCEDLFGTSQNLDLTHVYLLHGIMSGAAEANLELGLRVNLDSMRYILDALRNRSKRPQDNSSASSSQSLPSEPVRVVFPSSLAVFGPSEGVIVDENTQPLPQSSYGAQKSMVELLLNDLSRRGLVDARIVRLPTIIVRPGKPTGAASSFCSGIIREPLSGQEASLPVRKDLRLWVCSARTVIRNLVFAGTKLNSEDFAKSSSSSSFSSSSEDTKTAAAAAAAAGIRSRIINLPGVTTTVQEMLDALGQVGGPQALGLVKEEYDENVSRIVGSWPAEFDVSLAKRLGFCEDGPLAQTVREYVDDYLS